MGLRALLEKHRLNLSSGFTRAEFGQIIGFMNIIFVIYKSRFIVDTSES